MQYYHLGDLCPWDACSQFVGDLYPPPAPVWARQTPALVSEFTYVLVSASTEHLSDQQWEALADSVHVHALASAPAALGRLAFRGNLTARWEVALRELSLKPNRAGQLVIPTRL